jgi:hypothetical protein
VTSKIGRVLFPLYVAALLLYSQTWAATGDEGFHMLAAQLIKRGMRPWIDFCFPQAPLNAWWNAGWMRVFGETWRASHGVSALLIAGAVFLTARFVQTRLPDDGWRWPVALAAGLMTGLNVMVVEYGPLGQAYGTGLLLIVAAFRLTVSAAERPGVRHAAAAGLCAGAAGGCTLLTAPAGPVLTLWLVFQSGAKQRWSKLIAMCGAALVPWLPVAWLAAQGPRQAWFNLVEYHTKWRPLYWPDTTQHDLETIALWVDSGQAVVIGLLALAGIAYVYFRSEWPRGLKAEFYLCAWMSLGLSIEAARAHPTFQRYFVFIVPFVAILAAAGVYAMASRLLSPARAWLPVAGLAFVFIFGLGKSLYDRQDIYTWLDYEHVAHRIAQITPPGAPLFAEEHVYFLTRRQPPPGLEFTYSHKLTLPPAELKLLHVIPQAELDRQITDAKFATVYICEDEDTYKKLRLHENYELSEESEDCMIFWNRRHPQGVAKQ